MKKNQDKQFNLNSHSISLNIFWNLLGNGTPMLAALFAIPILIDGLGLERFGVLTLSWMVVGYFSLFDLGLGRALTKLVAEKLGREENEEDKNNYNKTIQNGLFNAYHHPNLKNRGAQYFKLAFLCLDY